MFPKAKHFQVRFLTLTTLVVVFLLTLVVWAIAYEAEVQNQLEPAVLPVPPPLSHSFFVGAAIFSPTRKSYKKGMTSGRKASTRMWAACNATIRPINLRG